MYLGLSLMVFYLPVAVFKDWICSLLDTNSLEKLYSDSPILNSTTGLNIPLRISEMHHTPEEAMKGFVVSGMEMEGLSSDVAVLDRFVSSVIEAVVAETAIVAACLPFMMGSLPNRTDVYPREPGSFGRVSIADIDVEKQPDHENKDGSETDYDEDNDYGVDDQDDDAGDEEDVCLANKEMTRMKGIQKMSLRPTIMVELGSKDDNGGSKDDDDDDDGKEEEEEDQETPQPPAKKRK
uniref:Uncharacterized protein n=1 Tax=Davidia involucrata TaxID=16924 RepID=A0A5B7BWG8_DAVIN